MAEIQKSEDTYSSAISDASNYSRWLVDLLAGHLRGDILEVGLGHGGYVEQLAAYGRYTGIDIDAEAVAAVQGRYPQYPFEAVDIASDAFRQRYAERFDAVVSMNVIEHIEDDARAVGNLTEALRVGGALAIIVPAMPMLYSDMDRLAGHYRRYTLGRLRQAVDTQRVEIATLRYFNPVGGLGWYVNKFRSYDSLNDDAINGQIALFDKYCVPVSRALSPILGKVFGQSALLIGKKVR